MTEPMHAICPKTAYYLTVKTDVSVYYILLSLSLNKICSGGKLYKSFNPNILLKPSVSNHNIRTFFR